MLTLAITKTIATAAVEVHFPEAILRASRNAAIMADAAHVILTSDARANTGNFYIDEDVLRKSGVTNFDHYAMTPGVPRSKPTDAPRGPRPAGYPARST